MHDIAPVITMCYPVIKVDVNLESRMYWMVSYCNNTIVDGDFWLCSVQQIDLIPGAK